MKRWNDAASLFALTCRLDEERQVDDEVHSEETMESVILVGLVFVESVFLISLVFVESGLLSWPGLCGVSLLSWPGLHFTEEANPCGMVMK